MNYMKEEYLFILGKVAKNKEKSAELAGKVNNKLSELKSSDKDISVSIVTYTGTEYTVEAERVNAKELDLVEPNAFNSRVKKSCFYDALNYAMDKLGLELAELDENDRPCKVTVITEESAYESSSKVDTVMVDEKVKHQQDVYSWNFNKI